MLLLLLVLKQDIVLISETVQLKVLRVDFAARGVPGLVHAVIRGAFEAFACRYTTSHMCRFLLSKLKLQVGI